MESLFTLPSILHHSSITISSLYLSLLFPLSLCLLQQTKKKRRRKKKTHHLLPTISKHNHTMAEPEEEEQYRKSRDQQLQQLHQSNVVERYPPFMMDLDLDQFDSSWPFEMCPFVSNPTYPFLLSLASPPTITTTNTPTIPNPTTEHPYSPLWEFSDGDDEKPGGGNTNSLFTGNGGGGLRVGTHPVFISRNPETMTGTHVVNEGKRKFHSSSSLEMGMLENLDESCVIKERMTQALRYFKESMGQQVLAQVWAPIKKGDRYVLTTSGQPFVLDAQSNGLLQYRTVSLMYIFSLDGESDGDLGLPGRVFRQKLPEWTPNVQYYSSNEYQRLNHALNYNVQGTLALPVFEPSGKSCVGVVELIMTSQKINYAPEVDKVCKALEAVNLKTSEILDHPNFQICNEGRQNALAEILEILTVVCETHKLPLAQTWIPCRHRSILAYGGGMQKSCKSFDGSCMGQVCMSTTDVALYVIDAHMWGFRDACTEHHLQKGQGVAGRAFSSQGLCFSRDVTKFSKTDYPLVHYARMFGLTSCFAICLRNSQTGNDDYVLEFFLPPGITNYSDQQVFLSSLLATMKQHIRNLKVASGKELEEEERCIEIIEASIEENHDSKLNCFQKSPGTKYSPGPNDLMTVGGEVIQSDSIEQHCQVGNDVQKNGENLDRVDGIQAAVSLSEKGMRKTLERRRGKTEKSISLEVLQQYFAGSLKDAAKSLGVCPTTMKRICRQHGISRWPSRKINKVNRSLTKLQRVIDSVQGAEGTFNLTSLTSPLPVAVSSASRPVSLQGPKEQLSPGFKASELQSGKEMGSPTHMNPENDDSRNQISERGSLLSHQQLYQDQCRPLLECSKRSKGSRTGSGSTDESTDTPTSHHSSQGSPANEASPSLKDLFVSSVQEHSVDIQSSLGLPFHPNGKLNLSATYSIPDALIATQLQPALGGMLIKDAGSSKDLRNLSNMAVDGFLDERVMNSSWTNPPCANQASQHQEMVPVTPMMRPVRTTQQDIRTVSIKVSFRESIIRFRLPLTSGLYELKEEVAKRLKLEVSTIEIKYLDDDHEWVSLVCDADLQECISISKFSGSNVVRLLVHDTNTNFESSCESSGD